MTRRILTPQWLADGYDFPADVEVAFSDDLADADLDIIGTANYVVLPYLGSAITIEEAIGRMKNVSVVQTLTAGFDNVLPYMPSGVTLCNAANVHDDSTSELAVTLTLSVLRDMPRTVHAQAAHKWDHYFGHSLADKRVLLIGYGGVGKATEKRLLAFDCSVTPVATKARDHVHALSEVHDLLPHHDIVVLTVPLNEGTRGLVDGEFLAKMPDGALLVNVARGPVVVTDALIAELKSGRLHAALDVTDPEPIPADHELWTTPNVLISPHLGGETDIFEKRARVRIHRQWDLWLSGQPLECVIV